MSSERWQRVKSFVHAALERGPARGGRLDEACDDNPTLSAAVESLLAQEDESFLENPAAARFPPDDENFLDRASGPAVTGAGDDPGRDRLSPLRKCVKSKAVEESPDELLHRILEEYGAWVRRALVRLRPRGMAIDLEDIEQEVALRLWKALQSGRKIDLLPSYLYRVAATATIDAIRKSRRLRESSRDPEDVLDRPASSPTRTAPSPEEQAARAELVAKVEHFLNRLPDNRRRAVALHLQGFSTHEAASLLGWPEPKTRNLTYRGLDALRRALRAAGVGLALD